MKDKEKQIEEMAKVMCGNDCEECAKESAEFYKQTLEEARNNKCLLKNCAKTLYEQGYRNLPKDSVVLSKEELEKDYVPRVDYVFAEMDYEHEKNYMCKLFSEELENKSKETAEKIYLQAKTIVDATKHIVQGREYLHLDALKEIIKNCGVEIKE